MAEFLREKKVRRFGLGQTRDKDEATRKILLIWKATSGQKLRWRDLVKEDIARNQMTTEMTEYRKYCHAEIRASTLSVEAEG